MRSSPRETEAETAVTRPPAEAGQWPQKAGTTHGPGSPRSFQEEQLCQHPEVGPAILTSDIWAPELSGNPLLFVVIRYRGPRE